MLRVALVNDYEVVVRGLAAMLRAYQDVVEVVELDVNMPVRQPVDIVLYDTFASTQGDRSEVHDLAANPRVGRVVVYSWVLDEALIRAAIANGAGGYVSKSVPAAQLVAALREINAGGQQIWVDLQSRPPITAGDWPGREEGLTARESEVLALITQGLSNAEIADRTHLSINSVKTYIRSAYRRIGVRSRTEAVLWGVEHGFRPDRMRVRGPLNRGSARASSAAEVERPGRRAAPRRRDDETTRGARHDRGAGQAARPAAGRSPWPARPEPAPGEPEPEAAPSRRVRGTGPGVAPRVGGSRMGTLYYGGSDAPINIEDRALAHLKIVITTKLRRGESFQVSWTHCDGRSPGRSAIWLHPAIPLRFVFDTPEPPELDRQYLVDLANSANTSGIIHLDAGDVGA